MGIREKINKDPKIGAVVVAAVLGLAVVLYFVMSSSDDKPRPMQTQSYYYDVDSKKLFAAPSNQNAPIKAPSGGEGVIAWVYSCDGDCSDPAKLKVGSLVKFTDEAKAAMDRANEEFKKNSDWKMPEEDRRLSVDGKVISAPDPIEWIPIKTKEGTDIRQLAPMKVCPNGPKVKGCDPPVAEE